MRTKQISALGIFFLALLTLLNKTPTATAQGYVWWGYTHLWADKPHAKVGDKVKAGDTIGQVGPIKTSGYGNADHLHFMKTHIDPTTINRNNLFWIFENPKGADPLAGPNSPGSFGYNAPNPFDYQGKHTGIDFLTAPGWRVLAVCDGTIVHWDDWPWQGAGSWMNTIWLRCDGGDGPPVKNPPSEPSPPKPPTDPGETPSKQGWMDIFKDRLQRVPMPDPVARVLIQTATGFDATLISLQEGKLSELLEAVKKQLIVWANGDGNVKVIIPTPPPGTVPTPTSAPIPALPPRFVPDKSYSFSIKAQKPDSTAYQYNVRLFFAGFGMKGKGAGTIQNRAKYSFEGTWELPPGGPYSVQEFWGWGCYEAAQAMIKAPGPYGTEAYGNGVCNTASMLVYVLKEAGLRVQVDDNTHPAVPGVPQQYWTRIWCPSKQGETKKDVRVYNETNKTIYMKFDVSGDTITLSTSTSNSTPSPQPTPLPTPPEPSESPNSSFGFTRILLIVVILVIGFLFFNWLRPGEVGQGMVWVADNAPIVKTAFIEAMKEALRWWLFFITAVIVFTPIARALFVYGFRVWIKGESTLPNWTLLVLFLAFLINLYIRKHWYARMVKTRGGIYVLVQPSRRWIKIPFVLLVILLTIGGLFYVIGGVSANPPSTSPPGSNPPASGDCSLTSAVPPAIRQWCNPIDKWSTQRDLDPPLVAAIIWVESNGKPDATSVCGAVGLMQVIPRDNGGKCGANFTSRPSTAQLLDPDFNIKTGTQILKTNIGVYGTIREGVMHYGPSGVGYSYADRVLNVYERFRGGK